MQVNPSAQLYRLQTLELTINKTRARIKQIEDLLGKDEDVLHAASQVETTQNIFKPLHTRAADLELELQGVTAKIAETDAELYNGDQSNPKALKELQDELNSLKRRESTLQESLIDLMLQVDKASAAVTSAETSLTETRESQIIRQADLLAEKEKLTADLATAETRRTDHVTKIDPAAIKIYEGLKSRMKGIPVAVLGPDGCSFCRVEQTSIANQQVRMGNKIVYCESCGRILASA